MPLSGRVWSKLQTSAARAIVWAAGPQLSSCRSDLELVRRHTDWVSASYLSARLATIVSASCIAVSPARRLLHIAPAGARTVSSLWRWCSWTSAPAPPAAFVALCGVVMS